MKKIIVLIFISILAISSCGYINFHLYLPIEIKDEANEIRLSCYDPEHLKSKYKKKYIRTYDPKNIEGVFSDVYLNYYKINLQDYKEYKLENKEKLTERLEIFSATKLIYFVEVYDYMYLNFNNNDCYSTYIGSAWTFAELNFKTSPNEGWSFVTNPKIEKNV